MQSDLANHLEALSLDEQAPVASEAPAQPEAPAELTLKNVGGPLGFCLCAATPMRVQLEAAHGPYTFGASPECSVCVCIHQGGH